MLAKVVNILHLLLAAFMLSVDIAYTNVRNRRGKHRILVMSIINLFMKTTILF